MNFNDDGLANGILAPIQFTYVDRALVHIRSTSTIYPCIGEGVAVDPQQTVGPYGRSVCAYSPL